MAFIIALYAIGFAFAALAAVRWPTLLMLVTFFGDSASQINAEINWRELGLIYGLIYLVAAFLFYTTSSLISQHKAGSVVTYVFAIGVGFPPFLMFDFEPGWWQNPDLFEQTVMFAGLISLFLFSAILELNRTRKQPITPAQAPNIAPAVVAEAMQAAPLILAPPIQDRPPVKPRRKPVSAAILRQRQSFAYHGRKAKARRAR